MDFQLVWAAWKFSETKVTSFWILLLSIYILESGHFPEIPQGIGHRFPLHMVPTDLPGLDLDSGVSPETHRHWPSPPPLFHPGEESPRITAGAEGSGEFLLLPGRPSPKSSKAKGFSIT